MHLHVKNETGLKLNGRRLTALKTNDSSQGVHALVNGDILQIFHCSFQMQLFEGDGGYLQASSSLQASTIRETRHKLVENSVKSSVQSRSDDMQDVSKTEDISQEQVVRARQNRDMDAAERQGMVIKRHSLRLSLQESTFVRSFGGRQSFAATWPPSRCAKAGRTGNASLPELGYMESDLHVPIQIGCNQDTSASKACALMGLFSVGDEIIKNNHAHCDGKDSFVEDTKEEEQDELEFGRKLAMDMRGELAANLEEAKERRYKQDNENNQKMKREVKCDPSLIDSRSSNVLGSDALRVVDQDLKKIPDVCPANDQSRPKVPIGEVDSRELKEGRETQGKKREARLSGEQQSAQFQSTALEDDKRFKTSPRDTKRRSSSLLEMASGALTDFFALEFQDLKLGVKRDSKKATEGTSLPSQTERPVTPPRHVEEVHIFSPLSPPMALTMEVTPPLDIRGIPRLPQSASSPGRLSPSKRKVSLRTATLLRSSQPYYEREIAMLRTPLPTSPSHTASLITSTIGLTTKSSQQLVQREKKGTVAIQSECESIATSKTEGEKKGNLEGIFKALGSCIEEQNEEDDDEIDKDEVDKSLSLLDGDGDFYMRDVAIPHVKLTTSVSDSALVAPTEGVTPSSTSLRCQDDCTGMSKHQYGKRRANKSPQNLIKTNGRISIPTEVFTRRASDDTQLHQDGKARLSNINTNSSKSRTSGSAAEARTPPKYGQLRQMMDQHPELIALLDDNSTRKKISNSPQLSNNLEPSAAAIYFEVHETGEKIGHNAEKEAHFLAATTSKADLQKSQVLPFDSAGAVNSLDIEKCSQDSENTKLVEEGNHEEEEGQFRSHDLVVKEEVLENLKNETHTSGSKVTAALQRAQENPQYRGERKVITIKDDIRGVGFHTKEISERNPLQPSDAKTFSAPQKVRPTPSDESAIAKSMRPKVNGEKEGEVTLDIVIQHSNQHAISQSATKTLTPARQIRKEEPRRSSLTGDFRQHGLDNSSRLQTRHDSQQTCSKKITKFPKAQHGEDFQVDAAKTDPTPGITCLLRSCLIKEDSELAGQLAYCHEKDFSTTATSVPAAVSEVSTKASQYSAISPSSSRSARLSRKATDIQTISHANTSDHEEKTAALLPSEDNVRTLAGTHRSGDGENDELMTRTSPAIANRKPTRTAARKAKETIKAASSPIKASWGRELRMERVKKSPEKDSDQNILKSARCEVSGRSSGNSRSKRAGFISKLSAESATPSCSADCASSKTRSRAIKGRSRDHQSNCVSADDPGPKTNPMSLRRTTRSQAAVAAALNAVR